ncbi:unnamed protein product, partial [Didymodactylos carnosus]
MVPLKIFLLAVSSDKPAITLLQNTAQPNAAYGCYSCQIKGITVKTGSGHNRIRVFPSSIRADEQPQLRKNHTYDAIIAYLEEVNLLTVRTRQQKQKFHDDLKGHNGPCQLRQLKMLMSANPSHLIRYIVSMVVFFIFHSTLPTIYFQHLLLLVISAHLAEDRILLKLNIPIVQLLMNKFVVDFTKLYGERHSVMNVHVNIHMSSTLTNFAQLYHVSTYPFESLLGKITSSIAGTKHFGSE